jgi:hypothetical protein
MCRLRMNYTSLSILRVARLDVDGGCVICVGVRGVRGVLKCVFIVPNIILI